MLSSIAIALSISLTISVIITIGQGKNQFLEGIFIGLGLGLIVTLCVGFLVQDSRVLTISKEKCQTVVVNNEQYVIFKNKLLKSKEILHRELLPNEILEIQEMEKFSNMDFPTTTLKYSITLKE